MIAVNGLCAGRIGGGGGDECPVNAGDGEMGGPIFFQPFFKNRSCNDGSREPIPACHNPHEKCRLSPSAAICILEYLVGVHP